MNESRLFLQRSGTKQLSGEMGKIVIFEIVIESKRGS